MADNKDEYGFFYSDGMDLSDPDHMPPEEQSAFLASKIASRRGNLMYPVPAYSFLLANRPDMLKYHFRQMKFLYEVPQDEPLGRIGTVLTMLHWYACNRVVEGVAHEVRSSRDSGATKTQINEIFALAFMHSGPSGFREVYHQAFDYMDNFPPPTEIIAWPKGWAPDPEAFRSGLDFDNPDFGPGELDKLYGWYESTIGQVPRSLPFFIKQNPRFMKAHRAKFEAALSTGGLPKQMVPFILLHYNMNRGFRDGIREATLLGKAWGMRKDHISAAITLGMGYMGGIDALYIVEEAIGDIFEAWD